MRHITPLGSGDRLFQRALSDDRVPIGKRLFMTATPRVDNEDVEGMMSKVTVVSMDNEEYYGPINTTFSDATNPNRPGGRIANFQGIAEAQTQDVTGPLEK